MSRSSYLKQYKLLSLLLVALDGKTLLLKITHMLVTGHGEIKLVLTRKLPSCWPAHIVLEGIMWRYRLLGSNQKQFSQLWTPWTAIMTCVAREMLWGQPTPFCLDLRPKQKKKHMPDTVNLAKMPCLVAYSLCGSAYYYYLLSEHRLKLLPKYP